MPGIRPVSPGVIGVILALVLWTAAASGAAPPSPPQLRADEAELVAWARSRFALVGLDLPEVTVSFHDDTAPCKGHDGIYHRRDGQARVKVCVPDRGTFAFALHRRRTLIHELAHAWEQANLDDEQRRAFEAIVGGEGWYAPEAEWEQRGAERFAETIVWGLYDQLRRPTLIDASCQELDADFRAITGTPAPGPVEQWCRVEALAADGR